MGAWSDKNAEAAAAGSNLLAGAVRSFLALGDSRRTPLRSVDSRL